MKLCLKIIPSRRCDNRCKMCCWSPNMLENDSVMDADTLDIIVKEGKGAQSLSLMTGEFQGYKEKILFPLLHSAASNGYPMFKTITSGIYLSQQDIDLMFEIFPGAFFFILSIDGPWGHRNYASECANGDVIARFIDAKHKYGDRIVVDVDWTHKQDSIDASKQRAYDAILKDFTDRCEKEDISVNVTAMSDFNDTGPSWGSKINPWKEGLGSPLVDSKAFSFCLIPVSKYNSTWTIVHVYGNDGYKLCQSKLLCMKVGDVGQLGEAGLFAAVQRWYDKHPRLAGLIRQGGVLQVVRELLKTDKREEIIGILDQDYPASCGICSLCPKLEPYFPLIEKV